MKKPYHPMRDAVIHIWEAKGPMKNQPAYIARLYPYNVYPIFATGATSDEAGEKLDVIRAEAIEKFEAGYIRRQEALALARAKRAAKEAAE